MAVPLGILGHEFTVIWSERHYFWARTKVHRRSVTLGITIDEASLHCCILSEPTNKNSQKMTISFDKQSYFVVGINKHSYLESHLIKVSGFSWNFSQHVDLFSKVSSKTWNWTLQVVICVIFRTLLYVWKQKKTARTGRTEHYAWMGTELTK